MFANGFFVISDVIGRFMMPDSPNDDRQHRRPHTPPMAAPFLEFDLMRELEQLHGEPEWASGQNARTLVKFDDFRVVLMTLRAQSRVPGHQTKGRLSIQTVVGHILVRAEGRTFDLHTGALLALDQCLPHDVEALEDSAFLLTIAWPG
jgi:quercetin dioxygenase-like cupin family protein